MQSCWCRTILSNNPPPFDISLSALQKFLPTKYVTVFGKCKGVKRARQREAPHSEAPEIKPTTFSK